MAGWQIGLIVMMAVGVSVILFGALWDRARNQRREQEILSPPPRVIPHFDPHAPAPQYLSDVAARGTAGKPGTDGRVGTALDHDTRERLRAITNATDSIAVGYASRDFITDPTTGWAALPRPRVLVCTEPAVTIRELLPALEAVQSAHEPLVVVAPDFDPEVLATLEVNRLQHRLAIVALRSPDDLITDIARGCGASPAQSFDLRAGYLPASAYGTVDWWISDAAQSWLVHENASSVTQESDRS